MPIELLMPALSPTMTEGNLVKWHKNEGDNVRSGELLAEIETDKATMEVEAVDEGTLGKILVPEGSKEVAVNAVIALILEEDEDRSALEGYKPAAAQPAREAAPKKPQEQGLEPAQKPDGSAQPTTAASPAMPQPPMGGRVLASPLAKRLADQHNLDLAGINGSGPKGRIVKADVLAAMDGRSAVMEPAQGPGPQASTFQPVYGNGGFQDVPISQMRKVIAQRLVQSKQEAPHFYVSVACLMDELLSVRKRLNEGLGEAHKVSVNDFIIKACAVALKEVPAANASWVESAVRYFENADVSVAVSIGGGLITPIVKAAELKSLRHIAAETKDLIKKARAGQLKPEEFQGGTFTVSNMGMYGVRQFNAVINPPQACIIAIGAAEEKAIVKDGALVIGSEMVATLSADHRAVDGVVAAEFMATFKKYVENPLLIMA